MTKTINELIDKDFLIQSDYKKYNLHKVNELHNNVDIYTNYEYEVACRQTQNPEISEILYIKRKEKTKNE